VTTRRAYALVVDDSADLVDNVCEILSELDDQRLLCSRAASGREALAECRRLGSELDLALVDLKLPDIDGMSLLRELRASCPFAEVLIITGNVSVESAVAAVGHGAFAYVSKPFRGLDLAHTAGRALAKAELERERERLRRELQDSEQRHRDMVEKIPAFVLALDADGQIVAWNQKLEEVTGFARSERLGRPGRELVGSGGERELDLRGAGKRLVRWQLSSSTGGVVYALGIDVTEEREMLRRTLRAERLAAVGTMAAGLAHEVRNPLNSSTLQLEVLRRRIERGQLEPGALLGVIDLVLDEIKRLARLVTSFLAFAQPRPLAPQPTDVNDLVQGVALQLSPEIEAHGCRLELELAAELPAVGLDAERFRQVLLNLTRNALEALAGKSAGRISLRTRRQGELVAIDVEDDGAGFPTDSPIFDAFFTTKESGTGLGLPLVHRIVDEHGGTVKAESKPGRTCFTVLLPSDGLGAKR
jgi:signal transduction histidine kinase